MIQNLPNEIWKAIPNYEGYLEVSNLGRIKALKRNDYAKGTNYNYQCERLKPFGLHDGYYSVNLKKTGTKNKLTRVHRIVLETFKPNKDKNLVINHINGNKLDNRLDNLEWCTIKENIHHAFKTGLCNHRRGEHLYNSKLKDKEVIEIRKLLKEGKTRNFQIAKIFNVSQCIISAIKYNRSRKHIQLEEK